LKNLREAKSNLLLYGKLTPAQSRDYENNELFLVEGNSAGGTAKLARDKKHQAILPLRGKVINAEKVKIKDLLNNEEICSIISCIGAGYGETFNIENIKYGKVIIMTDADTDGAHIQVLLLTFFYRYMRKIIENGMLYVALPPLFRFVNKKNNNSCYFWNEETLEEEKKKYSSYEIQRYKGLGEMDANQLRETTMNKDRKLIKVNIADASKAEEYVNVIMGDNSTLRKE
jgi:topoisomerase-4 subunit B